MKRRILTSKHLRLSIARAVAALCLALPGAAFAANYTWCGAGGDGMWTNSANWLLNGTTVVTAGYPGMTAQGAASTSDNAVFAASTAAEVTLADALAINTLNLSAAGIDLTLVGGPSGTNAPLAVASINLNGNDLSFTLDNICLASSGAVTVGLRGGVTLRNAAALRTGALTLKAAATSLTLTGGSSMLVQGNIMPNASGPFAIGLSGGSSLRTTGYLTLTAGNTISLASGSSFHLDSYLKAYLASSLSLAGGSSLSASELSIGYPGQTILIDDSTLESRGNCYLGDTAPGGGTVTFQGTRPLLRVAGATFRYNNNNAAMAQPVVFNYIVPEGGFAAPPLQHFGNTTTASFSGHNNVKAATKFTVDAASPALSAGTTTTTPLMLSLPGIMHVAKPYADISDATATLSFATIDGAANPATDAESKFLLATVGSGPAAAPTPVAASMVDSILPIAVAHKTLTASVLVTSLSTQADSSVLRLYAGLEADGSDSTLVSEEAVTAVGIHPVAWTAPAGAFDTTYYLRAEVADLDAGGEVLSASRSSLSSAMTVDAATYTWRGAASGNWSDPANWMDSMRGDCVGYPNSAGATATFPAQTQATIVLDGTFKVMDLNLTTSGSDLVFSSGGASTNAARLTVAKTLYANAPGGSFAFDGVGITTVGFSPGAGRTISLKGGASMHCTGDIYLAGYARILVAEDSWLSVNNLMVQDSSDADGYFIVDNATLEVRSHVYAPYNNKGGTLRLQGTRPRLRFKSNSAHFRSNNALGGGAVEFLIPAGGYAECPIHGTGAMTVKFGNNGNNNGTTTLALRVLPESPALHADASFTQPLVSWETAGINTSMFVLPAASETVSYVWGEGTYPTTLSAEITGTSHGDRLVVTGAPSEVPAAGIAYGAIDGLAPNEARTFTAPSGTLALSATRRATCTGWRLYAVDPATGARVLEDVSSSTTCDYVHDGTLHELEWQWREEFLVTPSAGTGGTVSAAVWADDSGTSTITATPDAGYVFREWTGVPADGLEFAASRPFAATGAATPVATFDAAIYASPDATASGDGTRANPYTLSAAITTCAARSDAAVVLLTGDYPISSSQTISAAVRITSETGDPADVTFKPALDAKGKPLAIAPLLKLTASGARLSNVTVSGGTPSGANCGDIRVENATLYNCVLNGITTGSGSAGGAAYLKNGRITRSRIGPNVFNNATVGGGLFMEGDAARVEYSLITNNFANGFGDGGGGIHAKAGTISHCEIVDNATRAGLGHGSVGGGIRVYGTARVEWCLIARNSCGSYGGGGLALSSTVGTVVDHCTIVGNNAAEYSMGGVNCGANAVMRNCIVWGNTVSIPTDYARNQLNASSDAFANSISNCMPVAFGNDTLVADPLFVNAAAGDYRLQPASPCIPLGYGCIPFDAETLQVCFPDFADDTFPANEPLSFTATASSGAGGYAYRWRVDDLVTGTDGAWSASSSGLFEPTLQPGHYRLTVEATDASGATALFSRELYAGVAGTVFVVPAGTAGNAPTPPYDTPATAANDPQDAIHYCLPGATLAVAGGHYPLASEFLVPRAVRVVASDGPEATSLYREGPYGGGNVSRVVHLRDAGAVLSGFTVSNGHFTVNNRRLGCGVLNEGGLVTNCVVSENISASIEMHASPAFANINGVVADCRIHDNFGCGGYGGGFFQHGAQAHSHDLEIWNHAITNAALRIGLGYSYGSGMGGKINEGLAERLYVHDNFNSYTAGGGGGGGIDVGNAELRNAVLFRNKAGANGGGGLRAVASGARIINCTVADNAAGQDFTSGKGGGFSCGSLDYVVTLVNTVFSGNSVTVSTPETGDPDWFGLNPAICTIRNCAFSSAASAIGENAIVVDNPRYVNPAGGDFTPGVGSSLRDAGADWDWTAADTDLAGGPRIAGPAVDIGAVEAEVDDSISCTLDVTGYDTVGAPVLVAITPIGANLDGFEARATVFSADCGVAATSGWGASLERAFDLQPGAYTVFVEVRNGSGAQGEAADGRVAFAVAPAVVYVVPEAAMLGAPALPFSSWETAATNLLDAVAVLGNGTRVVVTNGTHWLSDSFVVGKAAEVVSVEGPEKTEIVRVGAFKKGTQMQMVVLDSPGASLSGFTVRNGFGLEREYGALVNNNGGTVSNCVFTKSATVAMIGGAVCNVNGLVTHCVFTNLVDVIGDGGIYYQLGDNARGEWLELGGFRQPLDGYYTYGAATVRGGVLRNCVITNHLYYRRSNGSVAGGVYLQKGRVENCLIARNACGNGGGGIRVCGPDCEIVNCTIVSNVCVGSDANAARAGGIAFTDKASATILNTIVWSNRDESALAADQAFANIATIGTGAYTATTSLIGGANPKFRRFPSDAADYDFHLRVSSPARNAGTAWPGCLDALDLDGRPRVFGPAIDLGCYESDRKPGLALEVR